MIRETKIKEKGNELKARCTACGAAMNRTSEAFRIACPVGYPLDTQIVSAKQDALDVEDKKKKDKKDAAYSRQCKW